MPKSKALGSNPLRKLGHVGEDIRVTRDISDVNGTPDDPVIPYDRTTIYVRSDLIEWLRRRAYWDNVDITDSIEEALLPYKEKINMDFAPIPDKKRRRVKR